MNLEEFQRTVFDLIRQPLTADERMSPQTADGRSTQEVVESVVKPNDRLSSFERLEIYNRVYWFRILSSLAEDFPGLRAIIRQHRFDKLLVAFLTRVPVRIIFAAQSGFPAGRLAAQASGVCSGTRAYCARHGAAGMGRH